MHVIWILYCVVAGSTLSDTTTQPVNEFLRKEWCEAQLLGKETYCTCAADRPLPFAPAEVIEPNYRPDLHYIPRVPPP
jgi:hypothetical protein